MEAPKQRVTCLKGFKSLIFVKNKSEENSLRITLEIKKIIKRYFYGIIGFNEEKTTTGKFKIAKMIEFSQLNLLALLNTAKIS